MHAEDTASSHDLEGPAACAGCIVVAGAAGNAVDEDGEEQGDVACVAVGASAASADTVVVVVAECVAIAVAAAEGPGIAVLEGT